MDDVDEDMNSIVAFGHFLFSGQQSIFGIDRWDNPIILKQYSTAENVMDNGTNIDTAEGITAFKTTLLLEKIAAYFWKTVVSD